MKQQWLLSRHILQCSRLCTMSSNSRMPQPTKIGSLPTMPQSMHHMSRLSMQQSLDDRLSSSNDAANRPHDSSWNLAAIRPSRPILQSSRFCPSHRIQSCKAGANAPSRTIHRSRNHCTNASHQAYQQSNVQSLTFHHFSRSS